MIAHLTYEELLQSMIDKVPGNVDKREGSIIYDALAPCAYFLAQQNFQLENYIDLVFADTAVGEYLDKAVSSFGVTRKSATSSIRKMTTSGVVELGTRWGISNLVYIVAEGIGRNIYRAECESIGEIGNQYSGAMQPITNIIGITAELADIIVAGTDEETDDALRERFYQKVRLPATSGNAYHYRLWAREVPGVGDARVFPLDNGPGTVTLLIVNSDKTIDTTLEKPVSDYIETVRPIGAAVTIDSPTPTAINAAADIVLDGTKTKDVVLQLFKAALSAYLKSLVFVDYRVSFARIGSMLLSVPGIKDYSNLKLNAVASNVVIAPKSIPVMGTVTLSEVSTIGLV